MTKTVVQTIEKHSRHEVSSEQFDNLVRIVIASSSRDRKRLELLTNLHTKERYWILHLYNGSIEKYSPVRFDSITKAIAKYNRVLQHKVELNQIGYSTEIVVASSINNNRKQLVAVINTTAEFQSYTYKVRWKTHEPKSVREVETFKEAIAIYNAI